eukprot:TRINITY_DN9691_c0_g1_i3.p1 TRINITY_DN9691_c0_g1~~TRINITY_DN9691_c0_g1_i3.p1  ORF type:complete len:548 (+),score=83.61 TRINITY_DN9691_c0_g1_i3:173-1816(+)
MSTNFDLIEVLFSEPLQPQERPRNSFRHLTTKELQNIFNSLCHTLGQMESLTMIIDFLLDGIQQMKFFKKEAMHVLNQVILGIEDSPHKNEVVQLFPSMIEEYLKQKPNRNVLLKANDKHVETAKESCLETLLAMEGLGYILKVGGHELTHYVPEILYFCISNTSPSYPYDNAVLYFALCDIATSCDLKLVDLLAQNVDHLSRSLNLSLRQRDLTQPGLETLLSLVIRFSYLHSDPSIQHDIIDTITTMTLNLSQSEEGQVLQILRCIFVIVDAFKMNFQKVERDEPATDKTCDLKQMIEKLEKEKKEMEEEMAKLALDEDDTSNHENDIDENMPEEETEKKELNFDQKFLKTCLDHVQHFVSMSAQPMWQLTALDIISCCLELLAGTPEESCGERQENFLPLVHLIWSPLSLLFQSKNIFVVDKAFDCLMVLGKHARDFIHVRVVKEIMPNLVKFFQTLELVVKDKDMARTLSARESKRILEKMINGLWDLLALLDLSPIESDQLIQIIVANLSGTLNAPEIRCKLEPRRSLDCNILDLKLGALKA